MDVTKHAETRLILVSRWLRSDFAISLLSLPILLAIVIHLLSTNGAFGWDDTGRFKDLFEIIHPSIIATMAMLAWGRWFQTRAPSFAFLGVLSLFVLSRELIGQGSSILLYSGLIGLGIFASRHPSKIAGIAQSRWALSLILMGFTCYAFSQFLDRGLIKRIVWLLFWDTTREVPFSSNQEEALESLGGLMLMLSVFFLRPTAKGGNPTDESTPNTN